MQDDAALMEAARQFVADVDKELRKLYVDATAVDWANETDTTPEHQAAAAKAREQRPHGTTRPSDLEAVLVSACMNGSFVVERSLMLIVDQGRLSTHCSPTRCSEAVVETHESCRSGPAVGRLLSRQRDMKDIKHDRRIIDLNAVGAERAVCFQQNHPDIDKNDV